MARRQHNGSFRKAGSDHAYPVYDRRVILTLTRSEHQALVHERRKAAAASRKAKRQEEQMAHEGNWSHSAGGHHL